MSVAAKAVLGSAVLAAFIAGPVTVITKHFLNAKRNAEPAVREANPPAIEPVPAVTGEGNIVANKTNQGSGSIAQYGNNNTATINAVPVSRVLSNEKLEVFTAQLKKSAEPGNLHVIPHSSADDAAPLARQMFTAAISAGWAGASIPYNDGTFVDGLQCYSENWESASAIAFQKAMRSARLKCAYHSEGYPHMGGTNAVTVVVG